MVCTACKIPLKLDHKECTVCQFKLCMECFKKNEHDHKMKIVRQSQELLMKTYVRMLLLTYRNQKGNCDATVESLHAHITKTKLKCNCNFCKEVYLICNYHSKKCFTPGCRISRCPIVKKTFFKKRLTDFYFQQKLLKGHSSKVVNVADPGSVNAMLARKFSIQRCIRTMVHACYCLESDCMILSCQKMKRILAHIKVCKQKVQGRCTICVQLSALCCFHAKYCNENKCPVMMCSAYKLELSVGNKKPRLS